MISKAKDNRFIGTFVSEMYAILLGIGIGNVLFIEKLNLGSIYEVIMGLFVTGVVIIYWWDWTEFIGDHVVSSKAEFIIDFLILITLETLFLFYDQPVNLALVFVVLTVFDLCWVLNYKYQHSGNFFADNNLWILEKVMAIALSASIYLTLAKYLTGLEHYWKGAIVIATFIAIRKMSFRQVKKAQSYELKEAAPEDFEEIARMNNHYLGGNNKKSFMISPLSTDQINQLQEEKNHTFYILRKKDDDAILGFVEISPSADYEILKTVHWKDNKTAEKILHPNNEQIKYIEKIAVNKNFKRMGIGKALYTNVFEANPSTSYYAFVMNKPFNNKVSLAFHKNMRFFEAGSFNASEYAGYKNYQSILLFKPADRV